MNEQFDIKKVKVNRTLEGTIFEVAALIILIATWAVAAATGQAEFSEVRGSLVALIVVTIVVGVVLSTAYHPSKINFSLNTRLENIRQVVLAVRMCRVIAIELSLFFLGIVLTKGVYNNAPWMITPAIFIVITAGVFEYLIRKAK